MTVDPTPGIRAKLDALGAAFGNELLADLLREYLDDAGRGMGRLEAAIAGADHATIRTVCHQLVATTGSVGAGVLSEAIAVLAAANRRAELDEMQRAFAVVVDENGRVDPVVRAYHDEIATTLPARRPSAPGS